MPIEFPLSHIQFITPCTHRIFVMYSREKHRLIFPESISNFQLLIFNFQLKIHVIKVSNRPQKGHEQRPPKALNCITVRSARWKRPLSKNCVNWSPVTAPPNPVKGAGDRWSDLCSLHAARKW